MAEIFILIIYPNVESFRSGGQQVYVLISGDLLHDMQGSAECTWVDDAGKCNFSLSHMQPEEEPEQKMQSAAFFRSQPPRCQDFDRRFRRPLGGCLYINSYLSESLISIGRTRDVTQGARQ
jgi:hypothetical protein